jgi:hypothetical protein
MAGYRHLGRVSEVAESNETQGSATSPGFHAIEAATRVNGTQVPEFGYYAGPVATVTGRFGRKTVRAGLAPLSGHPGVFVFWFTSQHDATHLAAYNAAGTRLPSGHTRAGVG